MSLEDDFLSAQTRVKTLKRPPSNERLLELYSLFKQATQGDVSGSRPGALNFKARAKYDAWAERKGLPSEQAKRAYVDLVEQLLTDDR